MDKAFGNMDKRFKNIEGELNYQYNSSLWNDVEDMVGDSELDAAFINAASLANVPNIELSGLEDAFLDEAFVEASSQKGASYESNYFQDFKAVESELYQDSSFIDAAALSSAIYQPEFWNDADIALQNEGLHHEYKADYWREAEKLLLKDKKRGFFFKWGAAATVLLLFSFLGFELNQSELNLKQQTFAEFNSSNETELNDSSIEQTNVTQNLTEIHDVNGFVNKLGVENEVNKSPQNDVKENASAVATKKSAKEDSYSANDQTENTNQNLLTYNSLQTQVSVDNLAADSVGKLDRNSEFFIAEEIPNSSIVSTNIGYFPEVKNKNVLSVKGSKGLGNVFGSNSISISPRSSFFVDYRFSPFKKLNRVSFGVDLGLYHMNMDNFEYEQSYSVHHLEGNVDHYWSKVTYKDLVSFSAGLNTYLDFGKSSRVRLGIGFDRLLTSRIGMEYQTADDLEMSDAGTEWGLNRGINKLDLSLGLGYEYQLNSKFSFLIDSKIGTVDKTNNTYLHNVKSDRDISVLLGLKYNIFTH